MSRLVPALAGVAATVAVAAAIVGLEASGGDPVPDAGAAPASSVAPGPSAHRSAGWSAPAAVRGDRTAELSEEFRSGAALRRWGYFEGDFGRNRLVVGAGAREVVPPRSTWVDGHRGFYLYREVRGDFDVRARVRVSGRDGRVPTADWSLSGLLVRASPPDDGGAENWVALRVGRAQSRWVVERKSTEGSRSRLRLTPARSGAADLRIVRHGSRFVLFSRAAGAGGWHRRGAFVRADLPPALEVGIDAFGGASSPHPDLRSRVAWVRFARP
jgi:hypothetical protein